MRNTREIAAEYRLSHWAEILRQRTESGLSIKAYCEEMGMHENRYHYWQRKLREAAVTGLASPEPPKMPVPSGWAQVEEVKPQKLESAEIVVEIGRSRIVVKDDTDTELLTKVCKLLVELC